MSLSKLNISVNIYMLIDNRIDINKSNDSINIRLKFWLRIKSNLINIMKMIIIKTGENSLKSINLL
jgi:hypothetical protein